MSTIPLFLTTEVPVEVINSLLAALGSATSAPSPCVILTTENTSSPSSLSHLKSTPNPITSPLVSAPSTPFLTHTPADIYTFWKLHLRAPPEKPMPTSGWSSFTFLILDAESVSSKTVLVCSDAPDFEEPLSAIEEPVFKSRRFEFGEAAESLPALDCLSLCLSEVSARMAVKLIPPASVKDAEEHQNDDGTVTFVGRWANPAEARRRKAEAINGSGPARSRSAAKDSGARTLDISVGEGEDGGPEGTVSVKMIC